MIASVSSVSIGLPRFNPMTNGRFWIRRSIHFTRTTTVRSYATMSKATTFKAEHTGSLLRPQAIHDARAANKAGKMSDQELRKIEDEQIAIAAKKQQEVGLLSITDGEFRREYFHLDFLSKLSGVSITQNSLGGPDGTTYIPPSLSVTGKVRHTSPIQTADYAFLAQHVDHSKGAVARVSIPSPTMLHFRGGRKAISEEAYPDLKEFFEDLAKAYRQEIDDLYKKGCRYIQLDDTNLAYLCDPEMRSAAAARGEDLETLPQKYADLLNACLRDVPSDMTTGLHLCKGNFRGKFFASGGYEPVAEVLFSKINVDVLHLEWESPRSGDYAPLRFLPKDGSRTVVVGCISSKVPELESKESIVEKIHAAAKYAPLEQLAVSCQCGFSSTVHGNPLTEEDQWKKLALVVEVAKDVWGRV